MVFDDLLNNGQSKACSIFFAKADEGLEQSITNRFRDSRAVIRNVHFQGFLAEANRNLDSSRSAGHGLTGI